jgi:hypothetical protein
MVMKWIVPISLILMLQAACVHKNTEQSTHATQTMQASADVSMSLEQRIAVSISDDTAKPFVIDEPVPPTRLVAPGQKIRWTLINNSASKDVNSVTINQFHADDGDDSVCEDGTKEFTIGTIRKGEEKSILGCVVKEPATMPKRYKYSISVCGAAPPCTLLDPMIVITR